MSRAVQSLTMEPAYADRRTDPSPARLLAAAHCRRLGELLDNLDDYNAGRIVGELAELVHRAERMARCRVEQRVRAIVGAP